MGEMTGQTTVFVCNGKEKNSIIKEIKEILTSMKQHCLDPLLQ